MTTKQWLVLILCNIQSISFSSIQHNSRNPADRYGRNFTQRLEFKWNASLETLSAFSPAWPKWSRKPNFFVSHATPPKCYFSAADLREIWKQYKELQSFSDVDHLPQKSTF